jgi:hypothetical protein
MRNGPSRARFSEERLLFLLASRYEANRLLRALRLSARPGLRVRY